MNATEQRPRIAVAGSYGVGMTVRVDTAPGPGETVTGTSFSSAPGGKGSNQAIAARRLGAEVSLSSIVGPDAYGAAARELWNDEGVACDAVRTGTLPTMVGLILVEANGENRIAIAPGALLEYGQADADAFTVELTTADVLLASLEIPIAAVARVLRIAHGAGVPTVLNPAPASAIPLNMRPDIDHLLPNRVEAAALTGASVDAAPERLLDALREVFGCTIVLTLGREGVLVHDGSGITRIEAVRVRAVVDTTGAGDAFSAAYAVGLAEGRSVVDAARFAARAGAYAVTVGEVVAALPFRHQLESSDAFI